MPSQLDSQMEWGFARAVKFVFQLYKFLFSPFLHLVFGPSYGCRFFPSCSEYASEAVQVHGVLKGSYFSFRRVSRCNPFARAGYDPVPRDTSRSGMSVRDR